MPHANDQDPRPSTPARPSALAGVAALSCIATFTIGALQQQPPGDQPLAMIAVGCLLAVLARAKGWARPVAAGVLAMSGFPAWALIDLALHGGHSLLPFEFALYAVYACLGIGAALLANRWARQPR